MSQTVSFLLLVLVTISMSNSQIQFDGFVKFLKEIGELKVRLRNVQRIGSALATRADALDAAILKINKTMISSIGSVTSAMDSAFHLQSRLRKISDVVETTKHNMTKLNKFSNVTTSARRQLNNLVEEKGNVINMAVGKVITLESTVKELQKMTEVLKVEINKDFYEEMVNFTDRVEQMGCESGFGYEKSAFPSTAKLKFPRPFSYTPNVLYGMTLLQRAIHYTDPNSYNVYHYNRYYTLTVNITNDKIDDEELTMTVKKSSQTTLRELEFAWMACHI